MAFGTMARMRDHPWISVNGERLSLAGVDPNTTLLAFLRDRGLTGTKEGCAEGECGACAVALVRPAGPGSRYEAVNSCLVLAAQAESLEVWTAEGLARDGELHPVQRAMVESGGSQCGYCTPGFVVSLFTEYYRADRDGFDPESIAGNLCRCTGYRPIREAGRAMGRPAAGDPFRRRLEERTAATPALELRHGARVFHRPSSLADAFALLAGDPSLRVIAGGTDLVVDVNQRHVRHDALLALDAVDELRTIETFDDRLEIGAGVSLSRIEHELSAELPIFGELLPLFSSRLIRNRATLGGNLANASPIGDSPPVLLALDARVVIASAGGERTIPIDELFVAYRKTVLSPGELIVRVIVPKPFPSHTRFYKVSKRVLDDISTVAAAFALHVSDGVVERARLAYGGVAATPVRARAAEKLVEGSRAARLPMPEISRALASAFTPMSDHRGSADYRNAMVVRLFEKLAAELAEPAHASV
jgi:xanthine dehydrogenase small subunit